jgi:hypothetical protein
VGNLKEIAHLRDPRIDERIIQEVGCGFMDWI